MADLERSVLDFYQVSTPYPVEWPNEKDTSDVSEDEEIKKKINRRKSRYQALEKAVSNRASVLPGQEKSANGVGNIVQKDEPDPLGTTESVVRVLRQIGVPVQDDPRLRTWLPGNHGRNSSDMVLTMDMQATDSSCRQRPSPRRYSCPRCMRQPTHNLF